MPMKTLPPHDQLTICFAHAAYRMQERFILRNTGLRSLEVRTHDELKARIGEIDVLVVSGLWRNELIAAAPKLAFIQSISAGVDQYSQEQLRAAGIRMASAQGANRNAVSEHAMALILSLARKLAEARDNQHKHFWRGMISDIPNREDELGGKTLVIVGMGRIGSRLAKLARAFDMKVIGIKRDVSSGSGDAEKVVSTDALLQILPTADYVALTCPLTPQTQNIIDAKSLSAMKPSAFLVNVARGKVVDEPALLEALKTKAIAGAAIDCAWEEPLPESSPLWTCPNLVITPHSAGETQCYEDNIIDLLLENLKVLAKGGTEVRNGVV
ncbi:MAG: D-2-hydroxyacid dehydrogenase [Bradyrhizobium sp.]